MSDVLVPWWLPLLATATMILSIILSAWYDRFSKARLREAKQFYMEGKAIWEKIEAITAEGQLTEEENRALDQWVCERYIRP